MNASSAQWAKQAKYDIETARSMFDSGRYLYVLFCCQQAVEKELKAIAAERNNTLPPRIHRLVQLAEVASVPMTEDRADFLRELSAYYIQSRYPQEVSDLASRVSQDEVRRVLEHTEEMIEWLESTRQ